MNNIIRGISFGAVCNSCENNLITYPDSFSCIEFPCEKPDELEILIKHHCNDNVQYALHYPSYESASQIGFDLSKKGNRKMVYLDFLRYITQFPNAAYYLFHFPGHKEYGVNSPSPQMEEAFEEFQKMFSDFDDRIVIENLTCYTATCYSKLLRRSNFHLCLDIGHAYLRGENEIDSFFSLLKDRISVIHFYNTTNRHEHPYYGKHLSSNYAIESGINILDVLQHIYSLSGNIYLIDESDPTVVIT